MKKFIIILFLLLPYIAQADNYVSMTGFYQRAPENTQYYSFINKPEYFYGYIPYFRVFIPPGTIVLDLLILEAGNQSALAHHKSPPSGILKYPPRNKFSLLELESDQLALENLQGYLYITHDSFYPYLDISRAGWLYVKVDGGSYSPIYDNNFSVRVDTKAYNEWWDKYIKDESGWNKYVENVETYCITPSLSKDFELQIPLKYDNITLQLDIIYVGDSLFKMTEAVVMDNCNSIPLLNNEILIPDLILPDGTHVWVKLVYMSTITDAIYFLIHSFGLL